MRGWGDGPEEVAFVVLPPPGRQAFSDLLPRMARLEVVQLLNAGVDWVPALPAGVRLCNGSGVHDGPVAEWVVAVILAMEKRLPHFVDRQREGRWDATANLAFADGVPARDVSGARVLIVGHGSIGRAVAVRLAAFGADVTGVARRERADTRPLPELPDLLPDADVVVLLAPATDETRGLVDAAFLDRMKDGALLVNAARGSLVDTDALTAAARAGRVRAALDATDPEPLPDGHPLWSTPGILVTPHVAGSSAHWQDRAYALVGDQLRRWAAGEPLRNVRDAGY
jgi:phosphoglycerate dehydrogenase-like enzyme